VNFAHAEILLSIGIQANGLLDDIQAASERCLYFEDVLIVLGGKESLEAEPGTKSLARRKIALQSALEDGLIWHAATGKLGIPKEHWQRVIEEAHTSAIGGHFSAQRTTTLVAREFY
jgi:hypothetical protein